MCAAAAAAGAARVVTVAIAAPSPAGARGGRGGGGAAAPFGRVCDPKTRRRGFPHCVRESDALPTFFFFFSFLLFPSVPLPKRLLACWCGPRDCSRPGRAPGTGFMRDGALQPRAFAGWGFAGCKRGSLPALPPSLPCPFPVSASRGALDEANEAPAGGLPSPWQQTAGHSVCETYAHL